MSDQINDCSFYFYFICANWNIVVKIVDIVIMAQDLIALCNFFIQLIYRDNMYIIPLSNTALIVPPVAEQERIAAYLDEKCGEIDELIEVEQQMISDLRL